MVVGYKGWWVRLKLDVICGTTHPHLFYGGGCDEGVDVDDGGGE